MHKVANRLGLAAALGSLMLVGAAGCSMFSTTNAPIDCNIVKVQTDAGKTDAQIAAAMGAKESEVAACHGAEQTGNKTNNMIPQNY